MFCCSLFNLIMDDTINLINDIEQISVSDSSICSPEAVGDYLGNIDGFNILHVNIRSINCNFDAFLTLVHRVSARIDVFILSECFKSKIQNLFTKT